MRSKPLTLFPTIFLITPIAISAQPAEPLLKKLPAGVFVVEGFAVDAAQRKTISDKLGGTITRLTNSIVNIHGVPIKVNVITAKDATNAQAIHKTLAKPVPFSLVKDNLVIEYVVENSDPAIATKASYEFGLIEKPAAIQYQVVAELATIDKADYMSCNPLSNLLFATGQGGNVNEKIAELVNRFTFGTSLVLRTPTLSAYPATYNFQPSPSETKQQTVTTIYTFAKPAERNGIPFVQVTMQIHVDDSGLSKTSDPPGDHCTMPTSFWPADNQELVKLAQAITKGKKSNGAKAMAVLKWLQPNRNIKYSGLTGSRWGTSKVFDQKFGHCWDFSDCFVTLCRAAGVPRSASGRLAIRQQRPRLGRVLPRGQRLATSRPYRRRSPPLWHLSHPLLHDRRRQHANRLPRHAPNPEKLSFHPCPRGGRRQRTEQQSIEPRQAPAASVCVTFHALETKKAPHVRLHLQRIEWASVMDRKTQSKVKTQSNPERV